MLQPKIIFSFVSALVLTILCYFFDNSAVFTYEPAKDYKKIQLLIKKDRHYDDALFVNVAYDKILIPAYCSENALSVIGETPITDRQKLYTYLKYLKKTDSYKYIIVDLLLEDKDKTDYDDSLYALINDMERIVVADDITKEIDESIRSKAAYATYYSTIFESGFLKYEYSTDESPHIPLRVYKDLYEKELEHCGPLYYCDGALAQNTSFLLFNEYEVAAGDSMDGEHEGLFDPGMIIEEDSIYYLNLGDDIIRHLQHLSDRDFCRKIEFESKDKYIIIGDYINDIHDTYMGPKAGSVILYTAIKALENEENIVRLWYVSLWFVVYFFISLFVFNNKTILSYIPFLRKTKNKLIHYVFDMVTYAVLLKLFCYICFIVFNRAESIFIQTIFFTVVSMFLNYKKYQVQ